MPALRDLIDLIDRLAPWRLAESWDNCGLMLGSLDTGINKVVLALDPTRETVKAAAETGAQVLLTHHPLFFNPIKSLDFSKPEAAAAVCAIERRVAVVSAHTNLDSAVGGVAQAVAKRLSLRDIEPLEPAVESSAARESESVGASSHEARPGLGCIGNLEKKIDIKEFVAKIIESLELRSIRLAGRREGSIRRVALLPGSGGGHIDLACGKGAEVFISGDLSYHQARDAEFKGLCLIDAGHWGTERLALHDFAERLQHLAMDMNWNLSFEVLRLESDPWQYMEGRQIESGIN